MKAAETKEDVDFCAFFIKVLLSVLLAPSSFEQKTFSQIFSSKAQENSSFYMSTWSLFNQKQFQIF